MNKEYFIFIEGKKVIVTKEVYLAYWQETNREKYLKQLDRKNKLLFFCDFDYEGGFEESIPDESVDVEKLVEAKLRIESLNRALSCLNDEERAIIDALYFEEESTRDVAKRRGLHQTSLIRKRDRILKKLKEILEK